MGRLQDDADTLRYANEVETDFGKGCVTYNQEDEIVPSQHYSRYVCTESGWKWMFLLDGSLMTFKDPRDGNEYAAFTTANGQSIMAENLRYEYKIKLEDSEDSVAYGNRCNTDGCTKYGRYYSWAAAMDSAGVFSTSGKGCGINMDCSPQYPVRGICPEGWHLPSENEWNELFKGLKDSYWSDVYYGRIDSSDVPSMVTHALQAPGYNEWPRATNTSALTAIPAGYCNATKCIDTDLYAIFWSSTWYPTKESSSLRPSAKGIYIHTDKVDIDDFNNSFYGLGSYFSVRCFKDVQ